MPNSQRSIKRPAKGTLCVVTGHDAFAYRQINESRHVDVHAGTLVVGERVVYVKKQSGFAEFTSWWTAKNGIQCPIANIYDDYDWFLTRFGIVLLSRSQLALDI